MTATLIQLPAFSQGELVSIKRADMDAECPVLFRSWTQLSDTDGGFLLEGFVLDSDEHQIVYINAALMESINGIPLQ